jgi:hypothetical protein
MTLGAGAIVTVDELLRLQPTTYHAIASSDLVGSVTTTDITGATLTFDTETANAVYVAEAVFDFDTTTPGTTTIGVGFLNVDGSNQTSQSLFQVGAATANDRTSSTQRWRGTLATAGSHTLKLQGTVPANMEINATHTVLTVTIYEVL